MLCCITVLLFYIYISAHIFVCTYLQELAEASVAIAKQHSTRRFSPGLGGKFFIFIEWIHSFTYFPSLVVYPLPFPFHHICNACVSTVNFPHPFVLRNYFIRIYKYVYHVYIYVTWIYVLQLVSSLVYIRILISVFSSVSILFIFSSYYYENGWRGRIKDFNLIFLYVLSVLLMHIRLS